MSQTHSGNAVPEIEKEEHDGIQYAKKVSMVSAATLYAVTAGSNTGNTTLNPSPNFIGLVTNVPGSGTTIYPSPNYIGLVTVDIGTQNKVGITGNVTLSDPKTFIGLVTTQAADPKGFVGLVTLGGGTAWTDPKTYIGLVTVTGNIGNTGNVTLNTSPNFIGLVTAVSSSNVTLFPSPNYIGLATVDIGTQNKVAITGNVTLSDPKSYIGLVTVGGISTITLADPKGYIGLVTLGGGTAWTDPKTYIGLVTANNVAWIDPKTYIGLATIDIGTQNKVGITGNVTLSDPKTYIGLVTIGGMSLVTLGDPKGFIGLVTVGNKGALQKTVQTELRSIASVAPYAVDVSSTLDVSSKFAAAVYIDYAPTLTSIPSTGTEFRIEGSEKSSGSETWRTIQSFFTNTVAASVASTGASFTAAGATVARVLSNTGFKAGDFIFFANITTLVNSEWGKIAWISTASIVLTDGLTNQQDSSGVWNQCQSFIAPLDVTPFNRIRVVCNNATSPGLPISLCWRVAAQTADTVG